MTARADALLDLLQDLYRHQHWADAQVWSAVHHFPAAHEDADLRARLMHLHGVQQLWLARWEASLGRVHEGEPPHGARSPQLLPRTEDFPDWETLRHFAHRCHEGLDAFLTELRGRDLPREVVYKSLHGEPFTGLLGDLMLHLPMHSAHHRGQIALSLHRLGIAPPDLDLVTWQRMGRPKPDWI